MVIFHGLQNHCRWWLQPWNKKTLTSWKKSYEQPAAAAAAKSLQSCPTLCDPIASSSPGSPFPGILQARTLEWVAISFSNGWKWKVKVKLLSHVQLLATPWTAAYQAPPSMGFSRQEYWSGVLLPSLMWNLKRYKWTYLQYRNRFTDFKNVWLPKGKHGGDKLGDWD